MEQYQKRQDYQNDKEVARQADSIYSTLMDYNDQLETSTTEQKCEYWIKRIQDFIIQVDETEFCKNYGELYDAVLLDIAKS